MNKADNNKNNNTSNNNNNNNFFRWYICEEISLIIGTFLTRRGTIFTRVK